MKIRFLMLLIILILIPNLFFIYAQDNVRYPSRDRAAQYYLGAEDELLVPVNIWGFVQKPGQYLVPNNTDLVSLLSFAGGPTENAKISSIRLIRSDSKLGSHVYNIDLQRYIENGDERINPTLKPGDTIIVKGTTFHWINRFFEFVSRLAIFAQIYYFIVISQDYLKK